MRHERKTETERQGERGREKQLDTNQWVVMVTGAPEEGGPLWSTAEVQKSTQTQPQPQPLPHSHTSELPACRAGQVCHAEALLLVERRHDIEQHRRFSSKGHINVTVLPAN